MLYAIEVGAGGLTFLETDKKEKSGAVRISYLTASRSRYSGMTWSRREAAEALLEARREKLSISVIHPDECLSCGYHSAFCTCSEDSPYCVCEEKKAELREDGELACVKCSRRFDPMTEAHLGEAEEE